MYRSEELKIRTRLFAIRIVKLFRSLPNTEEARVIGQADASFRNIGRSELARGLSRSVQS